MSERIFRMTAIFESEDMAKSIEACLAPLNDEEYDQVDSCIKELGGKPVFSKMEAVGIESMLCTGNFFEMELLTSSYDKLPPSFFKALGAKVIFTFTYDEDEERTTSKAYAEGKAVTKKEALALLDELTPEIALTIAAAIEPKQVNHYLKKIEDYDILISGKPLMFSLLPLYSRYPKVVEAVLTKADVTKVDPTNGDTALHALIRQDKEYYDECRFLLERGADPVAKNRLGETALMAAAKIWDTSPLHCLLNHSNCEINAVDDAGFAALHYICMQSNPLDEGMTALIDSGADVNQQSPQGTPKWLAERYNPKLLEILNQHDSVSLPGSDSYAGTQFDNLKVALQHNDTTRFIHDIAGCQIDNGQVIELAYLACLHGREAALMVLLSKAKGIFAASTQYEGQPLFNALWTSLVPGGDYQERVNMAIALFDSDFPDALSTNLQFLSVGNLFNRSPEIAVLVLKHLHSRIGSLKKMKLGVFIRKNRTADYEKTVYSLLELGINLNGCLTPSEIDDIDLLKKIVKQGYSPKHLIKMICDQYDRKRDKLLSYLLGLDLQFEPVHHAVWRGLVGEYQSPKLDKNFLLSLIDNGLDINKPVKHGYHYKSPLLLARINRKNEAIHFLESMGAVIAEKQGDGSIF